jgi:hypothetical protein
MADSCRPFDIPGKLLTQVLSRQGLECIRKSIFQLYTLCANPKVKPPNDVNAPGSIVEETRYRKRHCLRAKSSLTLPRLLRNDADVRAVSYACSISRAQHFPRHDFC